jgi:hypothetical protein
MNFDLMKLDLMIIPHIYSNDTADHTRQHFFQAFSEADAANGSSTLLRQNNSEKFTSSVVVHPEPVSSRNIQNGKLKMKNKKLKMLENNSRFNYELSQTVNSNYLKQNWGIFFLLGRMT